MLSVYEPAWMWVNEQFMAHYGVVVDEDAGTIVGVGPRDEMARLFPQARSIHWADQALVPGTINTHTHSFQHLLRGIAVDQPFLVWRDIALYRITPHLNAEAIYWGAKLAFSEMVLHGITTVVDFFYVHNQGLENDWAVIEAARDVGIRLVMARTFYDWEGAPEAYRETPDDAVYRTQELAARCAPDPAVFIHPAPHSVHGASDPMIQAGVDLARRLGTPYHIHVAEEPFEVNETLSRTGKTPVQHLADLGIITDQLIAIHLTWVNSDDIHVLGEAQSHLAYCPSSNMFLADGITPLPRLREAGVRIGLGTDGGCSNNRASIFEEMRMAALLQKVGTLDATSVSHREVWHMGTQSGAEMLGVPAGRIAEGFWADFVGIDLHHLSLLPWNPETLLANIVYAMTPEAIRQVVIQGKPVVRDGQLPSENLTDLTRRIQDLTQRWG
ncbi:amidohydrolase family protein [Sulfobacillus thermosulfidooxidans]|uniref:amidohydrolase family protein n=1 Tax=Sulfobacillus thermosulfidooxidans TaxID=28034 RepID=UPI0006B4E598|nr:amidohydrolase [Sulfobacillus thermosulfidooxidans]